ncbi:hypothetical protein DENSPDRAFT_903269 [Dentipellis sp. KUC8613]|nr:hypothetical protein DENSPDRAFT_903269 [Dentipellis sp. KUC8613]
MSPSVSPPSLLSSSTASHPSTSTQPQSPPPMPAPSHPNLQATTNPHTPPRGRARYGALSRDPSRVPLHRRGTSKTYERLEDLLREAGYKETRVFTPEAERVEAAAQAQERGSMRGVGAVVGFLAGLVQGQTATPTPQPPSQPQHKAAEDAGAAHWSPPASPLAHKQQRTKPSPRPPPIFTTSPSPSPSSASSSAPSSAARPLAHAQLRRLRQQRPASDRRGDDSDGGSPTMRPQFSMPGDASPARAYLRHMASAPNMVRRVQQRVPRCEGDVPPMPPSWLETVARALLGAPVGASVGGPGSSRASTVRGVAAFGGAGERGRGRERGVERGRARPALMMGASAGRARESPGVVVARHVVCRSAPASRDGSRVREGAVRRLEDADTGTVRGRGKKGKGKARARRGGAEAGPSLKGRVEDEGEGWMAPRPGVVVSLHGVESDEDEDDEDDDEGELDLARLLVHPKRQQSIQSLRRHLRPASTIEGVGAKTWLPEDDDLHDHDGDPPGRRPRRGESSRRASVEEGEWSTGVAVGGSRRRRGLPRPWTDWTAR